MPNAGASIDRKPVFSADEITKRWQRLLDRRPDVDVVLATSFAATYYLSGVPIIPWGRPVAVVLGNDGDACIVAPAFETPWVRYGSPIDAVRGYWDVNGPNLKVAADLVIDAIRHRSARIVAVEGRAVPAALIQQLKGNLPECQFPDVTDDLEAVRSVASTEELRYIKLAAKIAEAGMQHVLTAPRPSTELDIALAAEQAMTHTAITLLPADAEWSASCSAQSGIRSLQAHSWATNQPLKAGEVLQVNCVCSVWHYQGAVERAFLVGEPREDVRRGYETMLQAFQAARAAIHPGRSISTIAQAARSVYEAAGYEPVTTGLIRATIHELAGGRLELGKIDPHNTNRLSPGMVLSVEPWAIMPGVGAPRHCDQIEVSVDGARYLTSIPTEAIIFNG